MTTTTKMTMTIDVEGDDEDGHEEGHEDTDVYNGA